MNVVVLGETGSGKSSLVNLLLGRDEAAVSDGATGCTFDFKKYSTDSFNLFDTVGLSEGTHGTVKQSFAVQQLIDLLKSLQDGVSLLVFVMKKGRVTKYLEENYALFVDAICMKNVPVVLVITHCEMDAEPGQWWQKNKETIKSYGWNIKDAVCCCTLSPDRANPAMRAAIASMRDSTRIELVDVIQNTKLVPGWLIKGGWKTWFEKILPLVFSIVTGVVYASFPDIKLARTIFVIFLKKLLVDQGYGSESASFMASEVASAISSAADA